MAPPFHRNLQMKIISVHTVNNTLNGLELSSMANPAPRKLVLDARQSSAFVPYLPIKPGEVFLLRESTFRNATGEIVKVRYEPIGRQTEKRKDQTEQGAERTAQ